jgi:hypothetical protein
VVAATRRRYPGTLFGALLLTAADDGLAPKIAFGLHGLLCLAVAAAPAGPRTVLALVAVAAGAWMMFHHGELADADAAHRAEASRVDGRGVRSGR